MVSEVVDALICAPLHRLASTTVHCRVTFDKTAYYCTVLFVMLLQAVCFEAEGNKMKATSGAIIKVRTLMA